MIQLKNVFITLSNRSILSNISLSIIPNRILTIIGPNGAGKSTLVRVILGLLKPNKGNIIRRKNLKIGYVPQKINLDITFPISVIKFMELFNYDKQKQNILKALQNVQAEHLKNFQITKLSGGEIQKILLARALLNKPELLILDEPNQGIDMSSQMILYKLINKLRKQLSCSMLIVSHDLNLVMSYTDEVICLNNHICCSGAPEIVSKNLEFISIFGDIKEKNLALYRHNHDHNHINFI
ncbi:zinc ABC transporter ATP-binding protein ZnuC [Buchnera aphidicola]|uniref:zinc ABC transporter ATP-binding protein ZnuC n=1 Tax=Buchnera aphidicola TaxID=9 RepID=UPI003464061F